jgi:hypothetical protein
MKAIQSVFRAQESIDLFPNNFHKSLNDMIIFKVTQAGVVSLNGCDELCFFDHPQASSAKPSNRAWTWTWNGNRCIAQIETTVIIEKVFPDFGEVDHTR